MSSWRTLALWGLNSRTETEKSRTFLNSVELFIKNVPTVQLDPVLSETILISLSQDTCLKSWHHTTITLFQDLETRALWITIAWCLLVVRKPVIPQRLCKGKGINMMGEISYSLILHSAEVKVHALALEALTRSSRTITCLSGLKFVTVENWMFCRWCLTLVWRGGLGKESALKCHLKRLIQLICQKCSWHHAFGSERSYSVAPHLAKLMRIGAYSPATEGVKTLASAPEEVFFLFSYVVRTNTYVCPVYSLYIPGFSGFLIHSFGVPETRK